MKSFKEFLNKSTSDLKTLANRKRVSIATLRKQLEMGIETEKEHTSNSDVAKEIALDHLGEKPDYYTRLKKMEK